MKWTPVIFSRKFARNPYGIDFFYDIAIIFDPFLRFSPVFAPVV
jgi:hypothetical protein